MRVTASKVGLLGACQYWARPEAEWVQGEASEYADRGTRFHAHMEAVIKGTAGEPDHDIADRVAVATQWLQANAPEGGIAEVAIGWHAPTDTASVVRLEGPRGYPDSPDTMYGTADLVIIDTFEGSARVYDWKTGSAEHSAPQLRTLGLMVARALDLSSVTVAALEVDELSVREVHTQTLDDFDLGAHASHLLQLMDLVPNATPLPGAHCGEMYCPARATCPTGAMAASQLVPIDDTKRRLTVHVDGPEHAVWMLDHIRLIEAQIDAIKNAIKSACPKDGWELPDGSMLMEGSRNQKRFDKASAIKLLLAKGATDEEIESLSYEYQCSAGLRLRAAKKGRAA